MSEGPLRVAALETPHRFGDPGGALDRLEALLARTGPVDLALSCEAAFTGYVSPEGRFDLSPFAEPPDGPTARRLAQLARAHKTALGGSIVERDGDRLFNTYLLFGPEGAPLARYRKRHPWFPEEWASPGDGPFARVELGGVRLLLAVCFDVHFLAREARADLAWADALLFPTAWVDGDGPHDRREWILPPLARSFDLSVVNPNWAPGDPLLRGQGTSCILGPDGAPLASAPLAWGEKSVLAQLEPRRSASPPCQTP